MSELTPQEAQERVEELTECKSIGCSDCNFPIDLQGADTPLGVVAALAAHQQEHH